MRFLLQQMLFDGVEVFSKLDCNDQSLEIPCYYGPRFLLERAGIAWRMVQRSLHEPRLFELPVKESQAK